MKQISMRELMMGLGVTLSVTACADPHHVKMSESRTLAVVSHEISVKALGAKGDGQSDDTQAFVAAIRQAASQNATVYIPAGVYMLNKISLPSHTHLRGDGAASVLKPMQDGAPDLLDAVSYSPAAEVSDISLRQLRFQGNAVGAGFNEFSPLLRLMGVQHISIDQCQFVGFRGDGIYLGAQRQEQYVQHNRDITIRNSTFDGVNHQNRNAISVIDGENMLIEHNTFMHTSRADMPGAIDFEPNHQGFEVVRNIRIQHNRFSDIGGNSGAIVFTVHAKDAEVPPTGLVVSDNQIDGAGTGIYVGYSRMDDKVQKPVTVDIRLDRNTMSNVKTPLKTYNLQPNSIPGANF